MATDGLTDDFQEINLRDTEIECRTRPESDQVASRPSKIKQIWKRSIARGHRRHTTTPYVEKELLKCTISGPTNFGKVDLLEDRFKFSRHSIQACPFDIDGYGGLIMRDEFKVSRPKKMNLIVFLFEKIIIFTKVADRRRFVLLLRQHQNGSSILITT
ncbi:uncharacterized protein LOC132696973 isoform X2 [Cylas formicarius]|uniref:uncharacterized protein LOC132696973 isoform X2 n=1 Tax=Cylas formicarius TaxID=197179 RepID=UPI002958B42D|nr:uncharacterized protein LOC132696973 isoform X2 [Cylas formicarius]